MYVFSTEFFEKSKPNGLVHFDRIETKVYRGTGVRLFGPHQSLIMHSHFPRMNQMFWAQVKLNVLT